ncbi:MAG: epoxyqueuosine reductase [Clostridia bacterium]|nr:epoxyqueuosine reductase [Clostridia bacterium]
MNYKDIKIKLENLAKSLGASLVGFCKLDKPSKYAPSLNYGISIAVKLSDAVFKTIEDAPSFMYFQHYRTANALLDQIAFRLSQKIEELGFLAMPIAASQSLGKNSPYNGAIAHKTVAVLSGLGFVGKSGLFLSNEYGSKVRLVTILTNLPIESDLPIIENGCGDCEICKNACPAGAIFGEKPNALGERNIDAELCSNYMKSNFQDIGRGSVCGICIKVCPKNNL